MQAAQLAQMASTEMFQALYFSNHEREDERCVCVGVVYAILTMGVRVQIPRFVYIQLRGCRQFSHSYVHHFEVSPLHYPVAGQILVYT